jgi:glutamine synthetase
MTDATISVADLAALALDEGCEALDLRFTDVLGRWLGVSCGAAQRRREDGALRVSAANVAGWRLSGTGDLVLSPVAGTAYRDAGAARPTLAAIAQVHEVGRAAPSALDPRATLGRALAALTRRGVAPEMRVGAELEFHLFDAVSFAVGPTACGFAVTAWDMGVAAVHRGHGVRHPGQHLALPPADAAAGWRAEVMAAAERSGLEPLRHQHEAGCAQHEIALRHAPALIAADRIQGAKALVLAMAARAGKVATFMPLPLGQGPGSGLHLNLSFWRDGVPLLAALGGETLARGFVGGIFAHARALNALANPATNSFKRLARLYAPSARLVWGIANRGAAVRLPHAETPGAIRLELRFPDAAANPYLALAAVVMAGLDGIARGLDPGPLVAEDPRRRTPWDMRRRATPGFSLTLAEAVAALDADRGFLMAEGVFDPALCDALASELADSVRRDYATPSPQDYLAYLGV